MMKLGSSSAKATFFGVLLTVACTSTKNGGGGGDGSVATGDAWLAAEVPKILASDAYKNGGALFILWDEGSSHGDDPPFLAVSPNAKPGFVSQTTYDTSSFLLTVQSMLGVEPLPCASQPSTVPAMNDLFTVPVTAGP